MEIGKSASAAIVSEDQLIEFQLHLNEYITGIAWLGTDWVAASTAAGTLYMIDIPSAKILLEIQAHETPVQSLSSNGSDLIATSGQDGCVKIFKWGTAEPLKELEQDFDWIEKVEYSPDGNWLLVVAGTEFRLYKGTGELVFVFDQHESTVSNVCWRPDSKFFASACYSAVRFFDVRYKVPKQTLRWKNSMLSLSWSPDFKFLCSGTQDSRIHFWPLPYKEGTDFEMSGYRGKVKSLSWDSKSKFVASNCWSEIVLWPFDGKAPLGKEPIVLTHSQARITSLCFHNNSTLLATGDKEGLLAFYEPIIVQEYLAAVKLDSEVVELAWNKDGSYLAAGTSNGSLYIVQSVSQGTVEDSTR